MSSWIARKKVKYLGIPKYINSGLYEHAGVKYRFMVMQRFGSDLQNLFESNGKQFSIKTVLQLGLRIVC